MSQLDSLFSEFGSPALKEHLGESVTRYPLGDTSSGATVAGCIFEETTAIPDNSRGFEVKRTGLLTVPEATTPDVGDLWEILSVNWKTLTVPGLVGGVRILEIETIATERRSKGGDSAF